MIVERIKTQKVATVQLTHQDVIFLLASLKLRQDRNDGNAGKITSDLVQQFQTLKEETRDDSPSPL